MLFAAIMVHVVGTGPPLLIPFQLLWSSFPPPLLLVLAVVLLFSPFLPHLPSLRHDCSIFAFAPALQRRRDREASIGCMCARRRASMHRGGRSRRYTEYHSIRGFIRINHSH